MENLTKKLETLAFKKTKPFCYGCYVVAPTGRCPQCFSDDLMRFMEGVGVEYGTDWVIRELVRENLEPINVEEAFEQFMGDCYPETVKIGWIECDTVSALKKLDPVSWDVAQSEWVDNEVSDDRIITFDNGSRYFWVHDVEQFVEETLEEGRGELISPLFSVK